MTSTPTRIEKAITTFDFKTLFIEELGWDNYTEDPITVSVSDSKWSLQGIAEKRGRIVYVCRTEEIPEYPQRCAIERMVTKVRDRHFIVFIDNMQTQQVWQYAQRVRNLDRIIRPHYYEMPFYKGQVATALANWLTPLEVKFTEEETLTGTGMDTKMDVLAVERNITKNFYNEFEKQQHALAGQIVGLESDEDSAWYASLLMNRLMFTYFIQSKGLLIKDRDYLRHKLEQYKQEDGDTSFFNYYKRFLLKFFHDGLGLPKTERTPEVQRLIGDIPYLNGGLFEPHRLEIAHKATLDVPDKAFSQIFDFFDRWNWELDTRPDRDAREINPDILGYIFEKYINQKQMGAYYTKEDITDYISKNTIIPYLFNAANERCPIAFITDGPVWGLLRADPDRYIFPAVLHGVDKELPDDIAVGVTDFSQRGNWNKPAPAPYALPTETWREHVARRQRCKEIQTKLAAGEITQINDLITYNLDIVKFARDVIQTCEGKEMVAAFYEAITTITVLDPTCGSGAFLFAALNILAPLYDACLERMEGFVREDDLRLEREGGRKQYVEGKQAFRTVLDRMDKHPSRDYFILKSIIVQNLYGVDIMAEAVEIAKLRLFLKLASQVGDANNIEPLPDIDFNIRAGNTLIGYASRTEVEKAVQSRLIGNGNEEGQVMLDIDESTEIYARELAQFRAQQTTHGGKIDPDDKKELQRRLSNLKSKLDHYLAWEYAVDADNSDAFNTWETSHQPFHWYAEFHSIMQSGGFDVIIGNPPYVEYSKVNRTYKIIKSKTIDCGNIFAPILEKCSYLVKINGTCSYIVPISATSTDRTQSLQSHLQSYMYRWYVSFDVFPARVFEGAAQRLSIVILHYKNTQNFKGNLFSSKYQRWFQEERSNLMQLCYYCDFTGKEIVGWTPRIQSKIGNSILAKLGRSKIAEFIRQSSNSSPLYVHRIINNFIKSINFAPYFQKADGTITTSDDFKKLYVDEVVKDQVMAVLNSSLFYWYWRSHGDGFHCGYKDIDQFPITFTDMSVKIKEDLKDLANKVSIDLKNNSEIRTRKQQRTGTVRLQTFYVGKSKPIIDEIDRVLAEHYGFTEEELDFIINYDIKYRMGRDADVDDEAE